MKKERLIAGIHSHWATDPSMDSSTLWSCMVDQLYPAKCRSANTGRIDSGSMDALELLGVHVAFEHPSMNHLLDS